MSLQRAKDECAAGARNDRRGSRTGEVRASFRSNASSSDRRLGCAHADPYRALGRTAGSCVGVGQLLDSAAIPQPEYEAIKAKALV